MNSGHIRFCAVVRFRGTQGNSEDAGGAGYQISSDGRKEGLACNEQRFWLATRTASDWQRRNDCWRPDGKSSASPEAALPSRTLPPIGTLSATSAIPTIPQ